MHLNRHRTTCLVAAGALTLGVGLGSAGTATAADELTKATVKKIASKVVDKQADGLTVAHAATAASAATATRADVATRAQEAVAATTAANVGGFAADELTTTPRVFTIASVGTPGQAKEWLLPQLAPGTYDFRYAAAIVPNANGTTVACGFRNPSVPTTTYGLNSATFVSPFLAAWPTGGAVHTVAPGEGISFVCSLSGGTFTLGQEQIQITVTRLNGSTTGTVTLLP